MDPKVYVFINHFIRYAPDLSFISALIEIKGQIFSVIKFTHAKDWVFNALFSTHYVLVLIYDI